MPDELKLLVQRSETLYGRLADELTDRPMQDAPRAQLAATYAGIAHEHGYSLLMLVEHGNLQSAMVLLRVQLDVLVRALWIQYAASDRHCLAMHDAVGMGEIQVPNGLPQIQKMLEQLADKGPHQLLPYLLEFKVGVWKSLSSYVHGGVFALHQRAGNIPLDAPISLLKSSNTLTMMAAMLTTIVSEDAGPYGKMQGFQAEFLDCTEGGEDILLRAPPAS